MSAKTRIPFKNEQTQDDNGLPRAGETVVLFNSVECFGAKCMHLMDDIYWFNYTITPNQNLTGNSVAADYSEDGGTTWIQFYTSTTNEPVGDSTAFSDEIFIGNFQDIRVRYVNGAVAQTSFTVSMSLDARERGPSEV